MLILNAADVGRVLRMSLAIDAMKQAFAAFSDGRAIVSSRIYLPIARHAGISLIMPSFVDGETTSAQTLAVKVVSLFDSRDAAWDEAGDLIQPLQSGLIDRHYIHAELGELVLSRKPGRRHDREVTLFKSVGLAAQDAVAAQFALENANRLRIGQHVAW